MYGESFLHPKRGSTGLNSSVSERYNERRGVSRVRPSHGSGGLGGFPRRKSAKKRRLGVKPRTFRWRF